MWDLDGTLIDTSRQSLSSLRQAITTLYGASIKIDTSTLLPIFTAAQDITSVLAKDKLGWAAEVIAIAKSKKKITPQQLVSEWEVQMLRNRSNIQLMPGALDVVKHFEQNGVPQMIATMSNAKSVAVKRAKHQDLFEHMTMVITSDDNDVKNRKPSPDIYLVAAKRMGVRVTNCVVIEDSPEGCRSGFAAGAKVIAVADAWDSAKLGRGVKVHMKCASLLDIKMERFCLPPLKVTRKN